MKTVKATLTQRLRAAQRRARRAEQDADDLRWLITEKLIPSTRELVSSACVYKGTTLWYKASVANLTVNMVLAGMPPVRKDKHGK